jgi:4-amino-4-deoxy-L-arabinose transferase-like glycosyltransferase
MARIAFVFVLAVAAAARLWYLDAGVPHAVGSDEPRVIGRAVTILRTGDWNPHIFDDPTLVVYFHAVVAIGRFLWGALQGEWGSLDAYTIDAVYRTGRVATAIVGVATVWLTYKLARELTARPAALLAGAQLAVWPLHVRESHFIVTTVPMTALTTLAVWLSLRAARLHDVRAYTWAGAACGLAAAAGYSGVVSLIAPLAAWGVFERRAPQRWRTLAAILGAAAVAFLAAAPFTVLDLPAFLDGFAAQFSRSPGRAPAAESSWIGYLQYLSPRSTLLAVPLALAGILILLARRATRQRALPVLTFTLAYFCVITSDSLLFERYVLPLLPMLCVLSSVAALALLAYVRGLRSFKRPAAYAAVAAAMLVLLLWPPAAAAVRWLDQFQRPDTRTIAAEWLQANAAKGARIAVENNGPTYLGGAGFTLVPVEALIDRPLEWYRARADYLVISAADLSRHGDYLAAGPAVFQVGPTAQRWGPPILVVRLTPDSKRSP